MSVFTKQQRIAALAKRSPQMAFTSLAYLMDIEWLREAFQRTRKDGATGVDGQTWTDYAKNLDVNLQSLLDRAKSGTYRAPPVRRVHIPKGGSTTETRPIGIPTLEDKVLQRAVVMLLEPIYEQDFHPGSYGFRRGRSAQEMMPQRFESFGLAIHPEKTRLVRFHHPCRKVTGEGGAQGPGTFDLLGFTHYWGKGRQGEWLVKRKTAGKRLARAVRSIAQWCRKNRHRPVGEQHAKLCSKIRGHYAYYGITNNARSLAGFLAAVQRAWRKWLDRRNSRHAMDWERFKRLLTRYALPAPRIVHSYVNQRNHGLRNRMA